MLAGLDGFFRPQNDMFGCILMQFLTDRKHGQSITTKLTTTVQKIIRKFTVRPKRGDRTIPPLNAPLNITTRCSTHGGINYKHNLHCVTKTITFLSASLYFSKRRAY